MLIIILPREFCLLSGSFTAVMKRRYDAPDECDGVKKRRVEYATFQKWRLELDREHQTMSWLDCVSEKDSTKKIVAKLKCRVCTEFVDKIRCRKNFSQKWIVGADSVRISNVRDHARNDQHTHAMSLLKKQQSQSAGLGPCPMLPLLRHLISCQMMRERNYE